MTLEPVQYVFGAGAGGMVGFVLGLAGGGGSILAVPLMIYFVGVSDPHLAIGTSAFAVAVNAGTNLINHARSGTVKWRCAAQYAGMGVAGALVGSTLGKIIDGQKLLFLFALLMITVGVLMLRSRRDVGNAAVECEGRNLPKVLCFGGLTGLLSGFFGIGGGFLIVPGLVASTGMPIINAIGSSLVAVTAFGLATALNYALSGLLDWPLALAFCGGGVFGGWMGTRSAYALSARKGALNMVFAGLIFAVAAYMLWKSAHAL